MTTVSRQVRREVETEVDVLDADDEADEDVQIDPDLATPAD
jgi:hypothetical protein